MAHRQVLVLLTSGLIQMHKWFELVIVCSQTELKIIKAIFKNVSMIFQVISTVNFKLNIIFVNIILYIFVLAFLGRMSVLLHLAQLRGNWTPKRS